MAFHAPWRDAAMWRHKKALAAQHSPDAAEKIASGHELLQREAALVRLSSRRTSKPEFSNKENQNFSTRRFAEGKGRTACEHCAQVAISLRHVALSPPGSTTGGDDGTRVSIRPHSRHSRSTGVHDTN